MLLSVHLNQFTGNFLESVHLNQFTGNFLDIAQPYKLLASKY